MIPLLFVRHGPTEWNAAGLIQGQTDVPLSSAGRAAVAGWSLPSEFCDYEWVSSPLRRAIETARLLGLGDVRTEARLAEMHWGDWERKTRLELRAIYGRAMDEVEARGLDFHPPGGESPRQLHARLKTWFKDIASRGHPVGAVTHKGVIRGALALATGWDMTGKAPHRLDWNSAHLFSLRNSGEKLTLTRVNIGLLA